MPLGKLVFLSNLSNSTISDMSFHSSNIYKSSVADVHLTDCKFDNSILIDNQGQKKLAGLENAITSIGDLQEKISQGEKFNVNYSYFEFKNMNLENADFSNSTLSRAKFVNVNLNKANFEKTDLRYTVFDNSSLIGTNLSNSNLEGSSFLNSDPKSTMLKNAKKNDRKK